MAHPSGVEVWEELTRKKTDVALDISVLTAPPRNHSNFFTPFNRPCGGASMKPVAGCQWAVHTHNLAIAVMATRPNLSLMGGAPLAVQCLAKTNHPPERKVGGEKGTKLAEIFHNFFYLSSL